MASIFNRGTKDRPKLFARYKDPSGVWRSRLTHHLRSDLFTAGDLMKLTVDMSRPGGGVIDLATHRSDSGTVGHGVATGEIGQENGALVSVENG